MTAASFGLWELHELLSQPPAAQVRLLDVRILPADEQAAQRLCVPPGAITLFIRRLISRASEPLLYHRT